MAQLGLEGERYVARTPSDTDVSVALYRYDMKKSYYLRG